MNSDVYTRVFLPGATVAHFLGISESPNASSSMALCGSSTWRVRETVGATGQVHVYESDQLWHGTGSQEEEDTASCLAPCASCVSIIRHHNGGSLPEGIDVT